MDEGTLEGLATCLSEMIVSLDCLSQEVTDKLRPNAQVKDILHTLDRAVRLGIAVRVNTVVSALNIGLIQDMGRYLMDHFSGVALLWKLVPMTVNCFTGGVRVRCLHVDASSYRSMVEGLEDRFATIRIIWSDQEEINSHCLLLPDGTIVVPGTDCPRFSGNIETITQDDIIARFPKHSEILRGLVRETFFGEGYDP
jgi:hypothetical protein